MNYSPKNIEEIKARLVKLNQGRLSDVVAGFWVEAGDNGGEWCANVVYIMHEPDSLDEGWELDEVDDLCGVVSEELDDLVSYTYCWFRTKSQFDSEFSNSAKLKKVS